MSRLLSKCHFCSTSYIEVHGLCHIKESALINEIHNLYPEIKHLPIWQINCQFLQHNLLNKIRRIDKADIKLDLLNRTILINIQEKSGVAVWICDEDAVVIDKNGSIISERVTDEEAKNLPIVLGEAANQRIEDIIMMKLNKDEIYSVNLVEKRRWNIRFKNGDIIKLPEYDAIHSLQVAQSLRINGAPRCKSVDMRLYPKKIFCTNRK